MADYSNTEEKMIVIEGPISELDASQSRMLNMMKEMAPSTGKTNMASAVVGGLTQNAGLMSGALMSDMYQGERVQRLHCCIGGKPVVGEFGGANLLAAGDEVKAVVSQRDKILYVHAIQRPRDEMLWLPIGAAQGHESYLKSQFQLGAFLLGASLFFLIIVAGIVFDTLRGFFAFMGIASVAGIIMVLIVAFWVYFDYRPLAIRAERIFTALGFPDVEKLNMRHGQFKRFHSIKVPGMSTNYESVYYYQLVLDAHKSHKRISLRDNLPMVTPENRQEVWEAYLKIKAKYAPVPEAS